MPKSSNYELQILNRLNRRAEDLIKTTSFAVSYTQERVERGIKSVERVRAHGFGTEMITLRPPQNLPSLIDAQVFDSRDDTVMLNDQVDACSVCGSRANSLVAMVRFESLGVDLALCGDCYQALSDRALGQVT